MLIASSSFLRFLPFFFFFFFYIYRCITIKQSWRVIAPVEVSSQDCLAGSRYGRGGSAENFDNLPAATAPGPKFGNQWEVTV